MFSMHWNLWLAQPETERSLKSLLRIAVAVVAFWTLAAAYGLWSNRAALAAALRWPPRKRLWWRRAAR